MVTLKDIAEKANTSITTVSRVLNGTDNTKFKVKDETIRKIKNIAEEYNYIPNQAARSIKMKRSNTIGIVVLNMEDPFFVELYENIKINLWKYGYNSILFTLNTQNLEYYIKQEKELIEKLNYWHLDGLIFTHTDMYGQIKKLNQMYKNKKPIVVFGYTEVSDINLVCVDLYSGTQRALNYLISKNIRKIAFFGHKSDQVDLRLPTYKKVLEEAGIEIDDKLIVDCRYTYEEGYNSAMQLINNKSIPQAVFCINDNVAIGAMQCFMKKGYRVPQDINIVGVNDIELASYIYPSLTTVKQPLKKVAEAMSDIVIKQLSGVYKENVTISLESELVLRESTI